MATSLTGKKPSETYKDLLQVSNDNAGIDAVERFISDGEGTDSPLKISTTSVNIDNTSSKTFKIGGTTLTATATELNYVDGVTSSIQTQLDSKLSSLTTQQDSFLVGGSGNTIVNKTVEEVKTLLGIGGAGLLSTGNATNSVVQKGENSSSDGFAHMQSGKLITKTASASRTTLGLGTSSAVTFNSVSVSTLLDTPRLKLNILSAPITANSTNLGKVFYTQTTSGSNTLHKVSVIMKTAINTYAVVDLASQTFSTSGSG